MVIYAKRNSLAKGPNAMRKPYIHTKVIHKNTENQLMPLVLFWTHCEERSLIQDICDAEKPFHVCKDKR